MVKKKILSGKIVRITGLHALVVIENFLLHPVYGKYVRRKLKFRVKLDAKKSYNVGDMINFCITRPLSKKVFCQEV